MRIKFCTLAGIDDAVDAVDLAALSKKYPFVEWAVIYDFSHAGETRHPSDLWIRDFLQTCASAHKAMHLSGKGLLEFSAGNPLLLQHTHHFERIQINLDSEAERRREYLFTLLAQMRKSSAKQFILGTNEETQDLLPLFAGLNLAVLFDKSGGSGKKPASWPAPLTNYKCGYAGGITPENIEEVLEMLEETVPHEQVIWIDMESGIRTVDNKFDLHKAERVLKSVEPWTI